ncbi:MAG: hypothetical protein WC024_07670 [Shewanella sp.]|uniref:hypothetical protein n=1 Tax=Shewanella sp. TaxID=50422 RepID=UPI00356750E2
MNSISKRVFFFLIIGTSLLFSEHIPVINYITLVCVFIAIVYFYLSGQLAKSLFLILLFSAISQEGLNVFTFNVSGLSLFYLSVFILLIISIVKGRCEYCKLPISAYIYFMLILFPLLLSVTNIPESNLFIIKDFLIIVFLPFTFIYLFKAISTREVLIVFYCLIGVKVLVSLLLYLSGMTLHVDENLHNAMVVDNGDELGAFFTILIISIFLFLKGLNQIWLNAIFFLTCCGTFVYGLGFVGLGSQVVLMILFVMIVYAYKRKYIFLSLIPFLFLLYPIIDFSPNELLVYKLENIAGLIDNLNKDSIYLIPHSPQVRVVELINIFSYPWYNVMFGHGLGGYFTDNYFAFNKYIGKFDFSEYEIMTRRFYNPHNIAYGVLKLGIIWWFFIAYLFYTAIKVKDNEVRVFLLVATFVLFLNFGYAIKTSILLALVFIIIHNYKKALVCETKNKFH